MQDQDHYRTQAKIMYQSGLNPQGKYLADMLGGKCICFHSLRMVMGEGLFVARIFITLSHYLD